MSRGRELEGTGGGGASFDALNKNMRETNKQERKGDREMETTERW